MLKAIGQRDNTVQVSPRHLGEAFHVDGRQLDIDAVVILAGSGAIMLRGYSQTSDEPEYFNLEDVFDQPEAAFHEGETRLGRKLGLAINSA